RRCRLMGDLSGGPLEEAAHASLPATNEFHHEGDGRHEAPLVLADEVSTRMLEAYPALTKALAAYATARAVYQTTKEMTGLLEAQEELVSVMAETVKSLDRNGAGVMFDSIIEVQFEILRKLGLL